MTLRGRWGELLALGLLALAALAGVVLWPDLPAEMAVHFDATGTPDNYVPKPVGVFLAPAIGLGALGVVRYAARTDPSADPQVLAAAVVFVGGLIAYVQGLVLAYNLGYAFSMPAALAPVFVAAAALVGFAVHREGLF